MEARTNLSPPIRTGLSLLLPLAGALLVSFLTGSNAPALGAMGVISWFLGLFWYGLPGLGLRGGRPLFAGIGFATLGWLAFLLFRFTFIRLNLDPTDSGRLFIYLLVFEAFAVQIWANGVLFRSLADWRGPLTAAAGSGILFGTAAFLFFQEVYVANLISLLYFMLWGFFFGIIRLRTGSFLGMVTVQTLHSFTAWVALGALPALTPLTSLLWVYGLSALTYVIVIWRLWPKEEADYRI